MKASIQVMMSVISMTRFLDPDTASFHSKHAWARISSGNRSAKSTNSPAVILETILYETGA